jgi:predicted nucleic acid-binding Zn ribbon protein
MYCIKCGKAVSTGGKFCPHCGAVLPNIQTKKIREVRKNTSSQKSKVRGILVVGVLSLNEDGTWEYYVNNYDDYEENRWSEGKMNPELMKEDPMGFIH